MPRATVNIDETETKTLKSAPPDGFVVLRRMTYGESVQRRAMLKMSIETGKSRKDFKGEMAFASEEIQRFEFAHCIVDHNLEKEDGSKLNLSLPVDFASLDPRIGQEIEELINGMNNFEDNEDDLGN
jgi:hypothetical protein